jgi:hypothetical protein
MHVRVYHNRWLRGEETERGGMENNGQRTNVFMLCLCLSQQDQVPLDFNSTRLMTCILKILLLGLWSGAVRANMALKKTLQDGECGWEWRKERGNT